MANITAWIKAFRLRTLPLSVSGVVVGSAIAQSEKVFDGGIFALALSTTLFLQILSNLANDYGDTQNGADNANRVGPGRTVQSGLITPVQMKRMITSFVGLAFVSGVLLLYISHIKLFSTSFFTLLTIGIIAIWAALRYTMGKNPYGYAGWGDVSVFLFFGLFSVVATFMLYAGNINALIFLPAIAIGLLSVGVLNLNNLRDAQNDKLVGKKTLVVAMGFKKGKVYQAGLIIIACLSALTYLYLKQVKPIAYFSCIVFVPLMLHLKRVIQIQEPALIDPELKKLAIITLLFAVFIGISANF